MQRYHLPPWFLSAPAHINYFSPKTLQLLLRRCGFSNRYVRMTYPLIEEFMLKEGLCYINNPALGRACHHKRVKFELDMINAGRWNELEQNYIDNVELRIGRELVMVATKTL